MEKYLQSPAHKALWEKAHQGFKLISGQGWETRANYEHFWPLCTQLYKMAYGEKAELPDGLKASLGFMLAGHAGRTRKGIRKRPYFHHILMVVYLSWLLGLPLTMQIAAIHHDDVEDIPKNLNVTAEWVIKQIISLMARIDAFYQKNGLCVSPNLQKTVISTVLNLSNDTFASDKHAAQVAKMEKIPLFDACLKLLDRIANMQDMRQDAPKGFNAERIEEEIKKAWELANAMPIPARPEILALLAFATKQLQEEKGLAPA